MPAIPGATIALTRPPAASASSKTRKPDAGPSADQRRGQVDELHPEAQVGLVRAEAVDRLVVGEARERDSWIGRSGVVARVTSMAIVSTKAITVVLVDEAHLEVELGELGLAVAAQVLVAVAARDLEVAVDAGDHQQLLELLRALRQRVDVARLEARRHDEVAGALGRAT